MRLRPIRGGVFDMATKRTSKRTSTKKGELEATERGDALHRIGVLLEDLRGQQATMLEAMSSMRAEFNRRLDEGLQRVEARLSIVEEVVRKNSEDIRKNSEDIEAMKVELRRLRVEFEAREERVKIEALEQRVARIEQRLAG